jgi:hypothetical protein
MSILALRFELRRLRCNCRTRDLRPGPACRTLVTERDWYVVGVRPGGDRLILASATTPEGARQIRGRLAAHLEGYAELVVEEAGGLTAYDAAHRRRKRPCS